MNRKPRKTYIIKKVTSANPVPDAPRISEPVVKSWFHFDNLFRLLSLTIGCTGLIVSLVLSRDKLFTTHEERQVMQREAIRLELVERERIQAELAERKLIEQERLEKELLEKERMAREAEAKKQEQAKIALLKDQEAQQKPAAKKKRRKKDPIGNFFRKTFK